MSILSAHPNIVVAPEAMFMMNLYTKYARAKWNQKKILEFYEDLWHEKYLFMWNLDREQLKKELLSAGEKVDFFMLCRIVYGRYAQQQKRQEDISSILIGDKNPHYALLLPQLLAIAPGAKFIHIVRDYRDTILSYRRLKFELTGTAFLAWRWKMYNTEILKHSQKFPDRFLTVRYEDIVTKPEETLPRVCQFLGLNYNSGMLEFYRGATESWRKDAWSEKTTTPLDQQNIAVWKKNMSESDVHIADTICGRFGKQFGYEIASSSSILSWIIVWSAWPVAWLYTALEKVLFRLPFRWRSWIINRFRRMKYGELAGIKF